MSDQLEDLYLKGFMAYSAKDFGSAKKYWEQVLVLDPDHEKAKKGLMDLKKQAGGAPKKRSSKEVLQEIKSLYAAKNYQEALRLCDMLLKKYPNNKDLQGLRAKVDSRYQQQMSASPGSDAAPNLESTVYYMKRGEAFMDAAEPGAKPAAAADNAGEVEKLIQQGVRLYEIQDYEQALTAWQKALRLDPDNRIVKDYIQNVQAQIQADRAQPDAPVADDKPSKEALMEAYNKGLAAYESQNYPAAMEQWRFILEHHPNHKETLQCLEKTQAAMAQQEAYRRDLETAKSELASGNHDQAEEILLRLVAEAPELEGLDSLKRAIEDRKRQMNEIRTLELEEEEESKTEKGAAPTEDEITRYFTPDSGKTEARQVTRVIRPAKEKKTFSKWFLIGVPIMLILLLGGGYFGLTYYNTRLNVQTSNVPTFDFSDNIAWSSALKRSEDFHNFGNDFFSDREYALASLSFNRAIDIAKTRISEIGDQDLDERAFELRSEKEKLLELVQSGQKSLREIEPLLKSDEKEDPKLRGKADEDLRKGMLQSASERFATLLLTDLENTEIRESYADAQRQMATKFISENELTEAERCFKRAAVLTGSYELPRRHVEVLQRFFLGKIREEEKNQWFFFFVD